MRYESYPLHKIRAYNCLGFTCPSPQPAMAIICMGMASEGRQPTKIRQLGGYKKIHIYGEPEIRTGEGAGTPHANVGSCRM